MAAVIVPTTTTTPAPRRAPLPRPGLRVIPGGRDAARRRRRHPAVYRRRRILAAVGVAVVAFTIALAVVGAASLLDGAAGSGSDAGPVVVAPAAAPASDAGPGPVVTPPAGAPAPGRAAYVVQPGDTVWAIARRLQPEGDVRPLVDRIADRTDGGALVVGQRIPLADLVG
jgi:LysM repeat protein